MHGRRGRDGSREGFAASWGGQSQGGGRGGGRGRGGFGGRRHGSACGGRFRSHQRRPTRLQTGGDRIEVVGDPASPGISIAVEGCCHGELDSIYDRLLQHQSETGRTVDLLLCCGDFQSIRNAADLHSLAVPPKYRALGSFHEYYAGRKTAPILTVFVGGNHEASQPLQELPYGGWVAPNIYFMGNTGVVNFKGVRIGGISGIYKSHDYRKGRYEVPPFDNFTMRSVYHVRNVDVHRFLCYSRSNARTPDVMLSHDWPQGIEKHGDTAALLRAKPFFRDEMQRNELGSPPNRELLEALKPKWWFAAHMHVKFQATVRYRDSKTVAPLSGRTTDLVPSQTIHSDSAPKTTDSGDAVDGTDLESSSDSARAETLTTHFIALESNDPCSGPDLTQQMTRFLSLDKCLPQRQYLAIVHVPVPPDSPQDGKLRYDLKWLAVIRKTHNLTQTHRQTVSLPPVEPITPEDVDWIRQRLGDAPLIPESSFIQTVPAHSGPAQPLPQPLPPPLPRMGNPQTDQLLTLLELQHVTTVPYLGSFVGATDQCVAKAAVAEDENEIDIDVAVEETVSDTDQNEINLEDDEESSGQSAKKARVTSN